MDHLKVLYATDLHGNTICYEKLFEEAIQNQVKAVILGGDICPNKSRNDLKKAIEEQREFLESWLWPKIEDIKKHHNIEFFMITGNDDFKILVSVFEAADKKGTIRFLNHNMYKIGNMRIAGYPFVNPTPFHLKDWEKGDLEAEHNEGQRTVSEGPQTSMFHDLDFLGKRMDVDDTVFVIHAPPYSTKLDRLYGNTPVGSKAVKMFIEKYKPYLTLHGHIHESYEVTGDFVESTNDTMLINPGSSISRNKLNFVLIDLYDLSSAKLHIV